jgi:hypothetical protein
LLTGQDAYLWVGLGMFKRKTVSVRLLIGFLINPTSDILLARGGVTIE